jgi:hypothetical protein
VGGQYDIGDFIIGHQIQPDRDLIASQQLLAGWLDTLTAHIDDSDERTIPRPEAVASGFQNPQESTITVQQPTLVFVNCHDPALNLAVALVKIPSVIHCAPPVQSR